MKHRYLLLLALSLAFCLFLVCSVATTTNTYAATLGRPPCHHKPIPVPPVPPKPKPPVPTPVPCTTCTHIPVHIVIETWCNGSHQKIDLSI